MQCGVAPLGRSTEREYGNPGNTVRFLDEGYSSIPTIRRRPYAVVATIKFLRNANMQSEITMSLLYPRNVCVKP
jgi:hypothetical protein